MFCIAAICYCFVVTLYIYVYVYSWLQHVVQCVCQVVKTSEHAYFIDGSLLMTAQPNHKFVLDGVLLFMMGHPLAIITNDKLP